MRKRLGAADMLAIQCQVAAVLRKINIASRLVLIATVLGFANNAFAVADWPTRTVSIVVPYAPGGGTDIMARLIGQRLSEKYGKTFVIDNRGGASGTIGTGYAARAAADGHTLLYVGAVPTIIVPMMQKTSYDPQKDLVPVSIFGTGNYILAVKPSLPVNALAELIAYAKERPGKLNYASVGTGGLQHLGLALLAKRAGIDIQHIPYNGTMAVSALMSGDVDLYLGTSAEMINAGTDKVRRLGVGGTKRLPQLPDLPTFAETLPGFRVAGWNGMFAPAGTSHEIVEALVKDIAEIARDPSMVVKLTELGIEPVGNTTAEFVDIIRAEQKGYREALVATGLIKD
jgi:tripartite-type tricarboxylate transporter receptor subunit TctC